MRLNRIFSATLLLSVILVLVVPTAESLNYTTAASFTATVTGEATASSIGIVTTNLSYDYNLTEIMAGGVPAWFRSCTWGEFLFMAGGTGTGPPPIAFIGGDPTLQQTVHVLYWSDVPVDLYFLTHAQESWWAYHVSLWPYQFCEPPYYGWTYGWQGKESAYFEATLPASTCPCTFLIFNMNVLAAHIHLLVNGLEVSGEIPYNYTVTSTVTNALPKTERRLFPQVNSDSLALIGLIITIVAALSFGISMWARAARPRRKNLRQRG
jgi:hypothetical protein